MSHRKIQASLEKLKSPDKNQRILAFQELLAIWKVCKIPYIYDIIMKAYSKEPSPRFVM
ncbi:MAG: hypothetical protein JXA54_12955 [Candidatus Heimdallarchaeota archaeon]|nr:hypothetical protein [Candidatus Heimdallarchaeota archaeon]